MEQSIAELREQRLKQLFADCQREVLSQIIGPFGLSMAMFEDKNGGNVTTLHNFERKDDGYVATESDKALYAHSRSEYDRSEYELKPVKNAQGETVDPWKEKRTAAIERGVDEYTGRTVSSDGMIDLGDGRIVPAELDHVNPLAGIHNNKKAHLAMGDVTRDAQTGELKVVTDRLREMANDDSNLALTNKPLNASKKHHDLEEWLNREAPSGADGATNAEHHGVDQSATAEKKRTADEYQNNTIDRSLLKKQVRELAKTGANQAMKMGLRQAMGVLLTELVNGLFIEIKYLIKEGLAAGKTLLDELRERLFKVMQAVAKKIPDATAQLFQGGFSGFVSNLLTFLLNSFVSTGARVVAAIRESLLGLFKAFKMILFPPKHLTDDQALQEGLKMLTGVVVTSVGILLEESLKMFLASLPFLTVIAGVVSPVLMGIVTGLLTVFLAYQIDRIFDRHRHSLDEKFLDELIADAKRHDEFATELTALANSSFANIESFAKSISLYQEIGETVGAAGRISAVTLASLEYAVGETREQIRKSSEVVSYINESQSVIDAFLKNI